MFVEIINRTEFVRKKGGNTEVIKIVRKHKRISAIKMASLRDGRKR